MTTRATPGPWEYFQGAICVGGPDVRRVLFHMPDTRATMADARLVAAAPDMLEVLEAIAYWMTDAKLPCCFPAGLVHAAIAKAKAGSTESGKTK